MSYLKIENLYKSKEILLFKEVFCLEKVDGSSAHISFDGKDLQFFPGCAKIENFRALFNEEELLKRFSEIYYNVPITIYGEVYGGKVQGMSKTYGLNLRFVAFDVRIGKSWLDVPKAEELVKSFNLEFVHYVKTSTNLEELNRERNRDSVQAIRNGMGEGHPSEGIIIRPLTELTKNNGERVIAKYKKENFRETKSPRPINAEKLEVLRNAEKIADEWVVAERIRHVIRKLNCELDTSNIPIIIRSMLEDIRIEGDGEIEWSKEVNKAIGTRTALLVKEMCKESLEEIE